MGARTQELVGPAGLEPATKDYEGNLSAGAKVGWTGSERASARLYAVLVLGWVRLTKACFWPPSWHKYGTNAGCLSSRLLTLALVHTLLEMIDDALDFGEPEGSSGGSVLFVHQRETAQGALLTFPFEVR